MLQINQLSGFGEFPQETTTVFTTLFDKTSLFGPAVSTSIANLDASADTIVLITPISITGYSQFRLHLVNGTDTTATIDAMYIGQLSGTVGFASAPTQVKFNAANSVVFSTALETRISDVASYTPSGSGKLCIAFNVNSNNASLRGRSGSSNNVNPAGWSTYRDPASADAGTQSKTTSNYTNPATTATYLVYKVEGAP